MVQKSVCRIATAPALCTRELPVVGRIACDLEECLGKAGFFGQQRGVVGRRDDGVSGCFERGLEPFPRNGETRFGERTVA